MDALHPTVPLTIHYTWVLDIVYLPRGLWRKRYLVLAREELSNFVEGRALTSNTTNAVCSFVLEDIISRYGCFTTLRADRGELNATEATAFFAHHGIKLHLTTAGNARANGKSERGHPPIVSALVKSCDDPKAWPAKLHLALWADRSTHCRTTGFTPMELMQGQRPLLPIEFQITTYETVWKTTMTTEELLVARIRQLEVQARNIPLARERLEQSRLRDKEHFDRTTKLRPSPLLVGDFCLIYNYTHLRQHSAMKKFEERWSGPYVIHAVHPDSSTYTLRETNGAILKTRIAGQNVKRYYSRMGC